MSDRPSAPPPQADRLRELVCAALSRVHDGAPGAPVPGTAAAGGSGATPGQPGRDGRKVVTAADLDGRRRGERVDLPAGSVVTPAARDRAAELGLELVVGTDASRRPGGPVEPRLGAQERELVDQLTLHLSRELSSRDLEELACWCRTDCLVGDPDRVETIVRAGADRVGICTATPPVGDAIAPLIDHTLLKPEASEDEVARLCHEALEYGFASVCVNPYYVPLAADLLRPDPCVRVCTVAGFPLGANMPEIKAAEASRAIDDGADEIDMVINVGALKSRRDDWVGHDIAAVAEACRQGGAVVKVILETALLTDEEKERGCRLARDAGADFVKTSTGFGPGGATVGDVELMRRAVGRGMGVKAAGGIGSREEAARMIAAGATRIGASAGVRIVRGERSDDAY